MLPATYQWELTCFLKCFSRRFRLRAACVLGGTSVFQERQRGPNQSVLRAPDDSPGCELLRPL